MNCELTVKTKIFTDIKDALLFFINIHEAKLNKNAVKSIFAAPLEYLKHLYNWSNISVFKLNSNKYTKLLLTETH